MFAYLAQGLLLGLSAAASPGPFQAYLLAQSLKTGFRSTLPAAFAPLITDGPIITIIFLLLNRLPEGFLTMIRIAGGIFLLYLAWGALSASRGLDQLASIKPHSTHSLPKAILMNFLSPGPYIYWSLIAGPVVLEAWRTSVGWAVMFFVGFYFAFIGGNAALVAVFALARNTGVTFRKGLLIFSAFALAGFGAYQLWQGIITFTSLI